MTAGPSAVASLDPSSHGHSTGVAWSEYAALADRGATIEVSRSAVRPAVHEPGALGATATQVAAQRERVLNGVVNNAQSYGATLDQRYWLAPTSHFHITEWFGEPGWMWATGYHTGVDFATSCGRPAVAVTAATVARTGWDGPYGNQVRLRLENGDQVWYNHLSLISVRADQQVQRGQQVGLVGETGNAYGCHLHFEYHLAGHLKQAVNPVPYLARHGIHLR